MEVMESSLTLPSRMGYYWNSPFNELSKGQQGCLDGPLHGTDYD